MKLQLNKKYLIIALIIFAIEVLIAIYLKYGFIRHTFGDYLVVILLYCFIKSFIKTPSIIVAIPVLIFSYIIELLQLINILDRLNLNNNNLLKLIFGNTFQISDLVAYTLGVLTVLITEYSITQFSLKKTNNI
ncbi:DUF2809 domain-containing protein [Flavivirga spongiicola]|uniref:DUF2809 domain-containing protein n=1 Tax=Flavivirga spongiicola TaxID=421621 RepID=A0ABU7XWD6_9FLAO|nr:DUF2809 domain-containing protein [Flavivirga sp. MEBiC05379]MDO5980095.1 DUF2809 domain-containing protein [Flavivirga sp. MEBiC05379]